MTHPSFLGDSRWTKVSGRNLHASEILLISDTNEFLFLAPENAARDFLQSCERIVGVCLQQLRGVCLVDLMSNERHCFERRMRFIGEFSAFAHWLRSDQLCHCAACVTSQATGSLIDFLQLCPKSSLSRSAK
jgi:hypothetical protein